MKTTLLFTDDFEKSKAEIRDFCGHITQKFTNRVFVANFQDSESDRLAHSSVAPPPDLDDVSILMAETWRAYESKPRVLPTEQYAATFFDGVENVEPETKTRSGEESSLLRNVTPTSERLTDSIALGLVIVSGPTPALIFNSQETLNAILSTVEACQFLATAGQLFSNITFMYEIRSINIDAVPPLSCASLESCEAVFAEPALVKMGYNSGYQGMYAYVNDLLLRHRTRWAFMAFFTKYSLPVPGYANGVRMGIQCANGQCGGSNNTALVFARQTCKIFGALDENDNCHCNQQGGYFHVPNNNCASCTDRSFAVVPCLMQADVPALCWWTKGQIGWIGNLQPAHGQLSVAQYRPTHLNIVYKEAQSGRLNTIFWTGTAWAFQPLNYLPSTLGIPQCQGKPFVKKGIGDTLHALYRDENNQLSDLFWTGTEWVYDNLSKQSGPVGHPMAGNPRMTVSNSETEIHVVFRTVGNHIYDIYWQGSQWNRRNLTSETGAPLAAGDPDIISYQNQQIYVVYRDVNNEIANIYGSGNNWTYRNFSSASGAGSNALANGDPYIIQFTDIWVHVIYHDVNNHISDINGTGTLWVHEDLNVLASASPDIQGEPCIVQFGANTIYIAYVSQDYRLSLIRWNDSWVYQDLVAPPLIGGLSMASLGQNELHIVGTDTGGVMWDARLQNGHWTYKHFNL